MIRKNSKKIAIGALISFIILELIVALVVPSSPISFFNKNKENQEKIKVAKQYYDKQGISLDDNDITIEIVTDENGKSESVVTVSESKRNQAMAKAQSDLDNIISYTVGIKPPTRDLNTGQIVNSESDDNTGNIETLFPSIDEVVEIINISNARVREFINNSLNAKDEYGKLLLEQRWNESPSSLTWFPYILFSSPSTYGELQPKLNGECFFYTSYPDLVKLENQNHFYPWINTSSDSLYNKLITKKLYEKDITTELIIEKYQGKTYTLVNSASTFQYQSLIKVECDGVSYILGIRNNALFLLDAE